MTGQPWWQVVRSTAPTVSIPGNAAEPWFYVRPPAVIVGRIVKDLNGDGARQANEPFLQAPGLNCGGEAVSGLTVRWSGPVSSAVAPLQCFDGQPSYHSGTLPTGTYSMGIDVPDTWQVIRATVATVSIPGNSADPWFYIRPRPDSPPSQIDLSLTASVLPSEVTSGATVIYELTLRNDGSVTAEGTRVTTRLSSGLEFVSSGSDERCGGSTTIVCHIGRLQAAGVTRTHLAVRTLTAGRIGLLFTASSNSRDITPGNDSALVTLTILAERIESPEGNLLLAHDPIRRERPTIVLTHGWQSENAREDARNGDADLWTGTGALQASSLIAGALARSGKDVNVVRFIWPSAFTTDGFPGRLDYEDARKYVYDAGSDLGQRLIETLGRDYEQDIQFIGHSLGSAVNAYAAAEFLASAPMVTRARFTALDRPDELPPGYSNYQDDFFVKLLHPIGSVRSNLAIVIENYYSNTGVSFGAPALGSPSVPAYNALPLQDPAELDDEFFNTGCARFDVRCRNDHNGVHSWYRLTIDPEWIPSFSSRAYCGSDMMWHPFDILDLDFRLLHNSLNPCNRGWSNSLFGAQPSLPGLPDTTYVPSASRVTSTASTTRFSNDVAFVDTTLATLSPSEFSNVAGCALVDEPPTISCAETASSMAQATIDVPIDSAYLSFEYRFDPSADGEHAAVLIDDAPVWVMSASLAASGLFETASVLPIRGLSGHRTLTIAFYGRGAPTGRFEIRNLAVTGGSPERRYLAEGATGTFFDTQLALFNPHEQATNVTLRFAKSDGTSTAEALTLNAHGRTTIDMKAIAGLADAAVSTVVESGLPIVIDRRMSWDRSGYGNHAERAVESASAVWYLAEGSTSGDFTLFYLLQNPQAHAVDVVVRYLLPFGQAPIERGYTLPPFSRTTVAVDEQGPVLASTDVSAVVTAEAPIIVERAMYLTAHGQVFTAGHGSVGVTHPSTSWFLAEGATGPYFDLFVLIANPTDFPAQVRIDYLLSTGSTISKDYFVPANSRYTVWVDDEQIPGGSGIRPLANVAVSATVTSTNGVPIIVERTMWWPGPELTREFWAEAHNSAGATATGTRWALADGEVGGQENVETYVLIANTSTAPGEVRVRLFFADGESAEKVLTIQPRSRMNVQVSTDFPEAAGRRFGTLVESVGPDPAQIVVERAMYSSPSGRIWAAGTGALATRLQ